MGIATLALMTACFFYGTLCHAPLLARVLARDVAPEPARLAGHAVYWAAGESFPMIVPESHGTAEGVVVHGLSPGDLARLDFYEGGFAFHTHEVMVDAGGARVAAQVYVADPGNWQPGAPWRLADWVAQWGDIVTETAGDFMALYGERPAEDVLARYHQMLIRGASRVRAAAPAPALVRRRAAPGDIAVVARRQPYARFFALEEYDLRFRRFDGSHSPKVNRAVFVGGDAATVLPYDPLRDRVLLVEQFRPGPFARGDANPWSLEPIAGRIDAGETPEVAARREAVEEAGLRMGRLIEVAGYYPSPAAKTEFLFSFIGLADLPDGTDVSGAGVVGEDEDIRTHILGFEDLMALIASGEAANGPLLISALWLAAHREALRAAAR